MKQTQILQQITCIGYEADIDPTTDNGMRYEADIDPTIDNVYQA